MINLKKKDSLGIREKKEAIKLVACATLPQEINLKMIVDDFSYVFGDTYSTPPNKVNCGPLCLVLADINDYIVVSCKMAHKITKHEKWTQVISLDHFVLEFLCRTVA